MYRLARDKQIMIVRMAAEGNSIRSIERMTRVHRDTIMRLLSFVLASIAARSLRIACAGFA